MAISPGQTRSSAESFKSGPSSTQSKSGKSLRWRTRVVVSLSETNFLSHYSKITVNSKTTLNCKFTFRVNSEFGIQIINLIINLVISIILARKSIARWRKRLAPSRQETTACIRAVPKNVRKCLPARYCSTFGRKPPHSGNLRFVLAAGRGKEFGYGGRL
jgi:hypothetical protein